MKQRAHVTDGRITHVQPARGARRLPFEEPATVVQIRPTAIKTEPIEPMEDVTPQTDGTCWARRLRTDGWYQCILRRHHGSDHDFVKVDVALGQTR